MVKIDVIEAIVFALENIDVDYVRLSQKDYSRMNANDSFQKECSKEKIL